MKKLIMWNLMTLDGYFEGEQPWDLSFHSLVWGTELEELSNDQLKTADILIFGKHTYTGMAKYWATEEPGETADAMNTIRKIVCSRTLETADWHNTIIARDAVDAITKLKREGEGNMFVFGSATLSESLINANLFDEYRILIVPVILGKGTRLFRENLTYKKLTLLDARTLTSGGVIMRYVPTISTE